jgi:hypothetical protein
MTILLLFGGCYPPNGARFLVKPAGRIYPSFQG